MSEAETPKEPQSLHQKLTTWLDKQGYPLELRVAQELRSAGASVIQSDYYTDPEQSQHRREIDVVASWSRELENDNLAQFSLTVECKRSVDKPWILFSNEGQRLDKAAAITQHAATRTGERLLQTISNLDPGRWLPMVQHASRTGYSVVRAFQDNDNSDVPYQAMMSASNAAAARSKLFYNDPHNCDVVMPVVVIDGSLFECFLSPDNTMELKERTRGIIIWRKNVTGIHTIIHIVTANALDDFARDARDTAAGLLDAAESLEIWPN